MPVSLPNRSIAKTTSVEAPARIAPMPAEAPYRTPVFFSIISMYSASETRSRASNSMSSHWPSQIEVQVLESIFMAPRIRPGSAGVMPRTWKALE